MSTKPKLFQLPKDAAIYTASIFERSRELISYNLWSGLQQHRLDKWIRNFETDEERYFAAKVLDALIYRSKDQTVALMQHLFQRTIPDLHRFYGISPSLSTVYSSLKTEHDSNIRLAPVLPPSEAPIKSGTFIGRYLRRLLHFHPDWIIKCSDIHRHIFEGRIVVLIDDFLGTGGQFVQFVSEANLRDLFDSGNCIFAPLVAHTCGLQNLKRHYPTLHLATVETLDDSHALFHESSGSFPDGINSAESARNFYYNLMKHRQIPVNEYNRRGFGYFELLYAFEDAVPDNSLPILWWPESTHWHPLFDR